MTNPKARLGEGLDIYTAAMRSWIARTLRQAQGGAGDWFSDRVLVHFTGGQQAHLQMAINNGRLRDGKKFRPETVIEPNHMQRIVSSNWHDGCGAAFRGNQNAPTWIREVGDSRNHWAHSSQISESQMQRALDTCALVLDSIDSKSAARIRKLRDGEALPAAAAPPASAPKPQHKPQPEPPPPALQAPAGRLAPWRSVMAPHRDVQQGEYVQAEFAADLYQVISGSADPAYGDPKEFFRRTHITRSMQELMRSVVARLRGGGGEPVLDLRTAFGGGKTHTLLAVLHMVRHPRIRPHPRLAEIYRDAGGPPPPKTNVAVLVGTELDPITPSRSAEETGGHTVHSFWGEMAWQLAGREGFELVKPFDDPAAGSAPAGRVLDKLFQLAGPSVVLIDEVVAYLRNVDGTGGYGAHLTFFQALTESAKRNKNVTVLVSIPESNIEFGDARGAEIANQISNIFQRIGAPWQPLDHLEAFEVVRRRLFGDSLDEAERDRTCEAFAQMYMDSSDVPAETREPAYLQRLKQSYPIHPEVFDRLYIDWAGRVDRFQRTRGVLKLMADCIYRLWATDDASSMIMPGSLPLHDRSVKQQMIGYLNEQWNSPLDGDIDGENSEAAKIERETTRYGRIHACLRLTRAIFMGSAPGASRTGMEYTRVLLGVLQPDDSAALYGDALRTLSQRLSFLYNTESRYWFDTTPNLNRVAADRLSRIKTEDALEDLRERLGEDKQFRGSGLFARSHVAPQAPSDVADEQAVRLVILPPGAGHRLRESETQSAALQRAQELLDSRGASPRTHRNMLVFLAPDRDDIAAAVENQRHYTVWNTIAGEAERGLLQLDKAQLIQAQASRDDRGRSVEQQLLEAYKWLLIPEQDGTNPMRWQALKLNADAGVTAAERAGAELKRQGLLIDEWSPIHLKDELDARLWQGAKHISLRQVWDYFTTYLYLPRLQQEQVLADAVKEGARTRDFFGYAHGVDQNGKYLGLVFGEPLPRVLIDGASVLVEKETAEQHRPEPKDESEVPPPPPPPPPDPTTKPKVFFGAIELNPDRMVGNANQVFDEIMPHIAHAEGAKVKVSIEIRVEAPGGFDDAVQRTVRENAATLDFRVAEFEEG